MALDPKIVEILRCPKCKGELLLEQDERAFICEACRLRFEVIEGIPNFLLKDAKPLQQ